MGTSNVYVIVVVTYYTLNSVLMAFGLTCVVTCALTAYAMKSDRDFSAWRAGSVPKYTQVLTHTPVRGYVLLGTVSARSLLIFHVLGCFPY